MKPFVAPLAAGSLSFTPARYDNAAFAARELGNAGDSSDGFERAYSIAAAVLAGVPSAHSSLDTLLGSLDTAAAALSSVPTDDLTRQISDGLNSLNPLFDSLTGATQALMFNPSQVAGIPPPPAAPTFTGAGLGSVSGGSGVPIGDASIPLVAAGIGTTVVGGLAAFGDISLTTAATLGVAIPLIGGFIAASLLLVHFLGGGCGEPCLDASRAEQIYEAAATNLYAVLSAGMIPRDLAVAAMRHIMQSGITHEGQFHTQAAARGSANLQRVINSIIAAAQALTGQIKRPFDITAARRLYVSGPGWYPTSLVAADQLTDKYLEDIESGAVT